MWGKFVTCLLIDAQVPNFRHLNSIESLRLFRQ
jgi:hypothetical protein